MRTLMRVKFGSHLYGTETAESDTDYKSVHVPDADSILLQRVQPVVSRSTKQNHGEGVRNTAADVDDESYALHRYLQLLAEGQTVALDMLFTPLHMLDTVTPEWNYIRHYRQCLLTKKSTAFVGYCRTQANKYGIKGSRVAAAKKAAEFFAACVSDCGPATRLEEICATLYKTLIDDADEHTAIVQGGKPDRPETYFECCNRKVSFGNTVKAAYEVYARIYEEYGSRARMAESSEGVDWKALSHAVRVGEEALELLTTKHITFPLRDATSILAIKCGQVPYADVAARIENLLEQVDAAAKASKLPDTVDSAFIDDIVIKVYGKEVRSLSQVAGLYRPVSFAEVKAFMDRQDVDVHPVFSGAYLAQQPIEEV